jgi:hypothetical protein
VTEGPDRARELVPLAVAMSVAVAVVAALLWPLPLHLLDQRPLSAFHDGHVWAFRHVARLLVGRDAWSMTVPDVGYPDTALTRYIAWLPAVLAAPLQPLLGPVGAYNVALLLTPALNVGAAGLLLRRIAPRDPIVTAAGALSWALSAYALGSLANGQICKLQMWILPAWAWALTVALEDPRPRRGLVALAVVTFVGSFSEPSYALHLPLLGLAWGAALLVRGIGRGHGRGVLARGVAAVLVCGICLLPARAYYDPRPAPGIVFAHQPATRVDARIVITQPSSVATVRETLLGDTVRDPRPEVCNHPTYLGLPLVLVAIALALLRPGWRLAGFGTAAAGLAFAAGEYLVGDADYVRAGRSMLAMPARALDTIGYPLAASGMYYRLVALAGLGIVVLLVAGLAGRRRAAPIAVIIAALSVADAVRATWGLWPRPVAPLAGQTIFAEIARDPTPGAVLDLPVYHRAQLGSELALATLSHGRATSALPRNVYKDEVPRSGEHDALLRRLVTGDPAAGRAELRARGFAWVVLHTEPRPPELDLAGLERLLGPPRVEGSVLAWSLAR